MIWSFVFFGCCLLLLLLTMRHSVAFLDGHSIALNPFSTMTPFHIHSAYYVVILYSFRNICGG
ncbi:hypothetical protein E2C01_019282 [Portunus trituberculatus]|uniref:Uncharacterized protein n=1 Tax=Portunus trituberculatus TaxID=210409 RepID=A0A5B7DX61_PORTR|nr:hypothetical protein [Portunus trituberculatus]